MLPTPGLGSSAPILTGGARGAAAGAGQPLCPGLPLNHKRPFPKQLRAAPSPRALHLGTAHPPRAVPAAGVGPAQALASSPTHLRGGFPSRPGKAQVGRGWGEGGTGLRGFQPGNKTERTNPASKCTIPCGGPGGPTGELGAGQAGLRGKALRSCHFRWSLNLQAPKSRATAVSTAAPWLPRER